jgi:hypothetical protein
MARELQLNPCRSNIGNSRSEFHPCDPMAPECAGFFSFDASAWVSGRVGAGLALAVPELAQPSASTGSG